MPESIMCPNCSFQIEVSTALTAQLRERLRKEIHAEVRQREAALATHEDALMERECALERARRAIEAEVNLRVEDGRDILGLSLPQIPSLELAPTPDEPGPLLIEPAWAADEDSPF